MKLKSFVGLIIGVISCAAFDGSLKGDGDAAHDVADEFSEGHKFKVWDGNSTLGHVLSDWFPSSWAVKRAIRAVASTLSRKRQVCP